MDFLNTQNSVETTNTLWIDVIKVLHRFNIEKEGFIEEELLGGKMIYWPTVFVYKYCR